MSKRDLPGRVVAGAYILHAGLEKWKGDEDTAKGMHGMATGTYPFLKSVEPKQFLKLLAGAEIAVGAALLSPFVPSKVAGAALTGFSAPLVGLYARTPGMRRDGSIWPTPAGIGLSKDSWLLAMGLGLLASESGGSTDDDG